MRDVFTSHYQNNYWRNDESVSGDGSTLEATEQIRKILPLLFVQLNARTILDIPCGDFNWFREMLPTSGSTNWLEHYIGADIVRELVYANRERYVHPKLEFQPYDITTDRLPRVDVVLCRDLLGHLSVADVKRALANIKRSGSKYLLATTFPEHQTENDNIRTGDWRPINLASLYGLPDALLYINEHCTVGGGEFADKSLGLWKLDDE